MDITIVVLIPMVLIHMQDQIKDLPLTRTSNLITEAQLAITEAELKVMDAPLYQ